MSLAFYIDENVHGAITQGLKLRGIDVLTVQEDGRSGISDPEVLNRATELRRVMFSQDQDFLVEAQQRQAIGVPFPGVIYARQSRVAIGVCIRDLEIISQVGTLEELKNQVQYLPL